MKYKVRYYYLATGMEGRADERDYGVIEANCADDAKNIVAVNIYPKFEDKHNRDWFRGCLIAEPVK